MITTRRATGLDTPDLVKLHKSSRVAGLLSYLTPSLLEQYFYESLVTGDKFETFIAVNDSNHTIGVISIADSQTKAPRTPMRTYFVLFSRMLGQILRHPEIWIISLNYIRMTRIIREFTLKWGGEFHEIQLLLVTHEKQSQGIGEMLMRHVPTNVPNLIVQTQNPKAVKFYEKFGFSLVRSVGYSKYKLWLMSRVDHNSSEASNDSLR